MLVSCVEANDALARDMLLLTVLIVWVEGSISVVRAVEGLKVLDQEIDLAVIALFVKFDDSGANFGEGEKDAGRVNSNIESTASIVTSKRDELPNEARGGGGR